MHEQTLMFCAKNSIFLFQCHRFKIEKDSSSFTEFCTWWISKTNVENVFRVSFRILKYFEMIHEYIKLFSRSTLNTGWRSPQYCTTDWPQQDNDATTKQKLFNRCVTRMHVMASYHIWFWKMSMICWKFKSASIYFSLAAQNKTKEYLECYNAWNPNLIRVKICERHRNARTFSFWWSECSA